MHYALSAWIAEALKYKSLTYKHGAVHCGHCMKRVSEMHKNLLCLRNPHLWCLKWIVLLPSQSAVSLLPLLSFDFLVIHD